MRFELSKTFDMIIYAGFWDDSTPSMNEALSVLEEAGLFAALLLNTELVPTGVSCTLGFSLNRISGESSQAWYLFLRLIILNLIYFI